MSTISGLRNEVSIRCRGRGAVTRIGCESLGGAACPGAANISDEEKDSASDGVSGRNCDALNSVGGSAHSGTVVLGRSCPTAEEVPTSTGCGAGIPEGGGNSDVIERAMR